jgi:type I restriction enzyme, S subunit
MNRRPDSVVASLHDILASSPGARVQTGPFGSQLHADEYAADGVPVIMPQDIVAGLISDSKIARITEERASTLLRHRLRAGDIVLSRRGDLTKCAVISPQQEGWLCGTGCLLLRPGNAINSDWLAAIYRHDDCQRQIGAVAVGSTMVNLNTRIVSSLKIPRTPRVDQDRIAEIVDSTNQSIRGTERLIAKLRNVRGGLIADLLSRGIDEAGSVRDPTTNPRQFVRTRFGLLPKSWDLREIGDACSLIVDCPHNTPRFVDDGVLVARTSNIRNGQFSSSEASYVSEEQYWERVSRAEPMPGDLIFTREAPVGEAFVIPPGLRICLGQRVMLIRPDDAVLDSWYLLAQIYSGFVRSRIEALTAGTTNPHLNVGDLRRFLIPIPSIREQQEIATRISGVDERIRATTAGLGKLRLLKEGLTHALLGGRVRVRPEGA